MWAEPEEAASYPPVSDAVEAVPTLPGGKDVTKSPSITTTEPEESIGTSHGTSPETKTTEAQEKEEHAKDETAKEPKPGAPSHFKQTMSVTQIFEKIKCFSGNNAMDVVANIAGTHATNKRKGAITEIALTKREKRQRIAALQPNHEKPEGWDAKNTVSASEQCPGKKRGRKPKQDKNEKEEKKEKHKASAKSKTSKASAKAKARPSVKAASKAKGQKAKGQKAKVEKAAKGKDAKKPAKSTQKGHDSELDGDSEIERKKRVSRKSAAYHRAFKMAKTDGHDLEQCKVLAKKALYLNFK